MDRETIVLLYIYLMRRGGHKLIQYALGFSEGVTRGIFKSLVQKKLLKPRRGGSELTEDGIRFLLEIFRKNHIRNIILINVEEIGQEYKGVSAVLTVKKITKPIIEIRDAAVREGAYGALIMIYKNSRLYIPPNIGYLDKFYPNLSKTLINSLEPSEKDVVVVVWAKSLVKAFSGLFNLTETLVN
ncbi:MAG TPA: DUF4443 domain-containing protein [Thermoproteales archaeon]|nr:DUF4443 domain-containing protein [Thermoproteales archaeon]